LPSASPPVRPADIGLLADCDWIIEAVAERLDIKHALFSAIDKVRKPTAIVLEHLDHSLHDLLSPFSDAFRGQLPDRPLLQPAAPAPARTGERSAHAGFDHRHDPRFLVTSGWARA
jgi:hypothetical protein